jgi:hypothetical protein
MLSLVGIGGLRVDNISIKLSCRVLGHKKWMPGELTRVSRQIMREFDLPLLLHLYLVYIHARFSIIKLPHQYDILHGNLSQLIESAALVHLQLRLLRHQHLLRGLLDFPAVQGPPHLEDQGLHLPLVELRLPVIDLNQLS